jgi:large subunit ribosomal protein L21
MYAVIEESGGQRKVMAGDEIEIDLFEGGEAATGQVIVFDKVLLLGGEGAGGGAKIGRPYIAGATVKAEVIDPVVMGEKIYIYKNRPKKTYKRKTGHRQRYTRVKVTAING